VRTSVLSLGVTPDKITRVPIWVDTKMFREGVPNFDLHRTYPEFSNIILSIGRLQPEKNYAKLIKVFAHISRVHDDTMLIIVGSGPERERLVNLSRTLSVDKAVVILPWARDVVSYYKTSDIYVQPSLYEGWCLTAVEAMSAGTPVIMTDVGCAGEVVRNEETGLVVPTQSEEALTLALNRLIEDSTLRATLSLAGKEESKRLATNEETLALYKQSWEKAFGKKETKHETKRTSERGTKTKKKS
jgi:glycosyltransferase involved in cell wall biosynthesis